MDSDFEFLRRFERELSARAKEDTRREASPAPKYPRRWKPWVAAAAALLVLAAGIGFLANSNFTGSQASMAAVEGSAPRPAAPNLQAVPGFEPQSGGGTTKQGITAHYAAGTVANQNASASPAPGFEQTHQGPSSAGAPADLSKIIRDGQIAVTIDDGTFKAKAGSVAHIAAVNGGSILSSSTEGGDSGSFTVRVPAANFDKAMVQLSQLGTVDSSASQGQDVTAQFVDLKAHMKIYLSRRKVLFGLMDKATTIGQSLTLQNQLDQVQLKIDQITGQINYINNQVAESTIKVDLHEPGAAVAQSPDTVDNPSLGHAWDRAVQGLLNVMAATLIGLGYLIPLLIIAGIVFLIVRLVRRRRETPDEA
jgi:hypothetical protein